MSLRRVINPAARRLFSTTPARNATAGAGKLPFEKPIFEAPLLDKARKELHQTRMTAFYFDVVSILACTSVLARMGYYIVYGKESGADPLPRRSETAKSQ